MNEERVPDHIIELDLGKVAKSGLWTTILSLIGIFVLNFAVYRELSYSITLWNTVLFILGYIILIVFHEGFHLLGFRLFGGVPWKRMVVGIDLKMGIAYATTDQWMTNQSIRKALLLPFWMTGILPGAAGIYFDNGLLLGLAALLIGGAAGDFAMYWRLKKFPDTWLVKDDPEKPKLYLYEE